MWPGDGGQPALCVGTAAHVQYLDVHMHEGMRVYYIMYACMHACVYV